MHTHSGDDATMHTHSGDDATQLTTRYFFFVDSFVFFFGFFFGRDCWIG